MKKGKVFGKRQLVLASLVVALAAAVWINMKFASTGNNSNLGNGNYLAGSSQLGQAVEAGAGVSNIKSARQELDQKRDALMKSLSDTANSATESEDVKKSAVDQLSQLTASVAKEANIETIIKAKGFSDALVIIADDSVTVMVASDELLQSQTLQIQDAVVSQTGVELDKIKIITLA